MSIGSTFKVSDFTYKILSKNEVLIGTDIKNQYANAVDNNNEYSKDVYIPNYVTYKGIKYAVNKVGQYAFRSVQTKNFVIGKNIKILGEYAIYNPSVESILFEEGSECYKFDFCALSPSKTKEDFPFFLPSLLEEINSYGIGNVWKRILIYYCGNSSVNTRRFHYASEMTIYVTSKYPISQFMGVSTTVDDSITCKFASEQDNGNRQTSMCKNILSKFGFANNSIISTLFCSV